MRTATTALPLLLAASAALPLPAQAPAPQRAPERPGRPERPFPLLPAGTWSPLALRLVPDPGLLADLQGERAVRLTGVPVPSPAGFQVLELELERLRVVAPDAEWWVDGRLAGGREEIEAGISLWSGAVAGEPGSHAYLAFTTTGCRGWIERGDGRSLLVSVPEQGDWSRAWSVLVHETDPMVAGGAPQAFRCELEELSLRDGTQGESSLLAAVAPAGGPARLATIYECPIAVETDYQFFQLFGDPAAATAYAVSLWGAASDRFLAAARTYLVMPYLGIYTTPADPWSAQDSGGSCIDVLDELVAAWGGRALPGNAALAHLVSGATLGCGVGYTGVLCDASKGFAVSGNLHGMTSFPVPTQDALNWDFIVVAHETGHNFGAPHTHDYCPAPLDLCAPPAYYGACQSQQVCAAGTILSYCHLCAGGIANNRAEFHPGTGATMLARVQQSCLVPSAPASHTVRNGSGINPPGYVALSEPAIGSTWDVAVDVVSMGALLSVVGMVALPSPPLPTPFGELLIDLGGDFLVPPSVGFDRHSFRVPDDPSLLGITFATQAVTLGLSIRLQNAIDVRFGY